MLTIGRITHTVYEPHHRLCPLHVSRWQLRVIAGWQNADDAAAEAAGV